MQPTAPLTQYCSTAAGRQPPRATFPHRKRGSRTAIAIFGKSLGPPIARGGVQIRRSLLIPFCLTINRMHPPFLFAQTRHNQTSASQEPQETREKKRSCFVCKPSRQGLREKKGKLIAIFCLLIPVGRRFCFVAIRYRVPSFSYRPCLIPRLSQPIHKQPVACLRRRHGVFVLLSCFRRTH
ncbi:hypothetical protein CP532_6896 [Ophiocordyceps camponoti-leonardi (nom. inval.)]|nr:hypothetical protein CP532_6896 [Ophiocordyceps camponoti-leonardi (nom. inval.)]